MSHPIHRTGCLPALAVIALPAHAHHVFATELGADQPLELQGYKAKNGGPFGDSVSVALANGRSFQTGGAPDVPTAPR